MQTWILIMTLFTTNPPKPIGVIALPGWTSEAECDDRGKEIWIKETRDDNLVAASHFCIRGPATSR